MQEFPLAINLSANFLGNQSEGASKAVASIVKRGYIVSVMHTLVYGAGAKLVADATTNHALAK